MLAICSCQCGSTDSLIRNFLHDAGYANWMDITIYKGREKSLSLLNRIPQYPEIDMLRNFLKDASKWAVIIGWDGDMCRWSDIAHNATKSRIEAEFIVKKLGLQ